MRAANPAAPFMVQAQVAQDVVSSMGEMRFGAVLENGRFLYATGTWWWWVPGQHALVAVWNWVCCKRWGHNDMLWHLAEAGHISAEEADCVNCCARLTGCICHTQGNGGTG